jgi:hypothetical protein
LVLLVFVLVLTYRATLVFCQGFPPGADGGFHAGVINSISIQGGHTNFLWDPYQMGGEVELEFPGYHIFALTLISITGMPNYMAQGVVAVVLSTFTILAAYLVTRAVWNETAAIIAAILLTVSRLYTEIVLWAGYPNLTVLFLMPVAFYLLLKKDKIDLAPFLAATSLLSASILLTHSLSTLAYVGIIAAATLALLLFPKLFGETRKTGLYIILPLFIGAGLVSPFLASAVSPYLNSSAAFTGATAIHQAFVDNQTVPMLEVLTLLACLPLFFVFSKLGKKRVFSFQTLFLALWFLVPLLLTQTYLVGLYVDYVRFPYYLFIPLMALIGITLDYFSSSFVKLLSFSQAQLIRVSRKINIKKIQAVIIAVSMIALIFYVPIFIVPPESFRLQNYYQVMNDDCYNAIQWTRQNTATDAVFVSDASYGWWLAGLGQRPTLSAVDLRFLTIAHEANIARNATYLMDTDYVLDNGYIQVREDGGYLGRHNPLFLADLNWTSTPYSFFQFNSNDIILFTSQGNTPKQTSIDELAVTSMQLANQESDNPSIIVNKANNDLTYTEIIAVTKGQMFANMTLIIQSSNPNTSLNWLNLIVNSPGTFQQPFNNTLAVLDEGMKECGQLIFAEQQPVINNVRLRDPSIAQLSYDLKGKQCLAIQILVGIYQVTEYDVQNPTQQTGLIGTLTANLLNPPALAELPIVTFDYKTALNQYNVSYIENRVSELNPKFASDPRFSLVFINNEVAIFKVKADTASAQG